MAFKKQTVYTSEEQESLRRERILIGAVHDLLDATEQQHPHLSTWVATWRQEANSLAHSFDFYLSGQADPMVHRFAAEIDRPRILRDEVTQVIAFLLEEEERPEPHGCIVAVSLWGEERKTA